MLMDANVEASDLETMVTVVLRSSEVLVSKENTTSAFPSPDSGEILSHSETFSSTDTVHSQFEVTLTGNSDSIAGAVISVLSVCTIAFGKATSLSVHAIVSKPESKM